MNYGNKIREQLGDPLKTFRVYEIIIAIICIGLPAILRLYDSDKVYPVKVKFLHTGIITDSASNIIKDRVLPLTGNVTGIINKSNTCSCDSILPVSAMDSMQIIDKDRWCFRTSISDYAYSTNSYLFGMLLCIAAMLFIFNGAVYFKSQRSLNVNNKGKWYNVILGLSLLGVISCPHRDWPHLHYLFAMIFFFGNALVIGIFHNKKDRIKSITMAILTGGFLVLTLFKSETFTLFWGEWLSLTVIGLHVILEARRAE